MRHIPKARTVRFRTFLSMVVVCLTFGMNPVRSTAQVKTTLQVQSTTFTYQGRLTNNAIPANGSYDMIFTLYDTATTGTGSPQGSPAANVVNPVQVSGGIFTVQLDFGAAAFTGADR